MATAKKNYQQLSEELDDVLEQLQDEDLDVDTALKLYEQGLKLVGELEGRLTAAENKVRELKVNGA
jgi:exodeoxyribonuclease VII small subunit